MIFGGDREDLLYIIGHDPPDEAWGTMVQSFDYRFVLAKLSRLKTVRRWVGTDVLKCELYWHYRLRAKICNWFIDEHCFVSSRLKWEFTQVFTNVVIKKELYPAKMRPYHRKFNVLVYMPNPSRTKKLRNYIYGTHTYNALALKYPHWNWLVLYGGTEKNVVDEVFFRTDVLFRPNGHDGAPRMVMRAKMFDIPVVWDPEKMCVEYAERELLKIYEVWDAETTR